LGAAYIREAGGEVLVQDEASSVVWGMPGAVVSAGAADKVCPLSAITQEIVTRVSSRAERNRLPAAQPAAISQVEAK
jgi:two-component system chemotaxis response regulator CheB